MTVSPSRRYTVDTIKPQRKKPTLECLEKASGARDVDSELQVKLEKDGTCSTRHSWMESSGLWPMLHWYT